MTVFEGLFITSILLNLIFAGWLLWKMTKKLFASRQKSGHPMPELTEWDIRCMAYHEAGHAVCSYYSQGQQPLICITINPSSEAFGMIRTGRRQDHNETEISLKGRIAVFLSGRLSEEILLGEVATSCVFDFDSARQIAADMVIRFGMGKSCGLTALRSMENFYISEKTDEKICDDIQTILHEAEKSARDILNMHRRTVQSLAELLLEKKTLMQKEIEQFFQTQGADAK